MCTITVTGGSILEAVYAAKISVKEILGLPAMNAFELCMAVAGVDVIGSRTSKESGSVTTSLTYVVSANCGFAVPAHSGVVIPCIINGVSGIKDLMIGQKIQSEKTPKV